MLQTEACMLQSACLSIKYSKGLKGGKGGFKMLSVVKKI